jgi:hypothetical protein
MRHKYVEERFQRYFEHGVHPDGKVDVADINSTIATVTPDEARRLIADRDAAVNMLCALAVKLDEVAPEVFSSLWYAPQTEAPS